MALLNTPIICVIIICKSNVQCVGNVDVSYVDYCCTFWVLFNCSITASYAHAQLYQNAMQMILSIKKKTGLTRECYTWLIDPVAHQYFNLQGVHMLVFLSFSQFCTYMILWKNSKIMEYQPSQLHRTQHLFLYEATIFA